MVRHLLAVVVVALSVAGPSAASAMADPAPPPTIHWSRDKKEPRWVDGYTVVDTPPEAVWTALQRVPSWPTMFSDIKTMKVKRQEGSAWRLEMSTQTFDCGSHDYDALFQGERSVSIRINAPGVDAVAYVRVRPGPKPEQSVIHYDLYVDATGVVGWFVSEKALRLKQEGMAVRYLNDLHRVFTPARPKP